MTDNHAAEEESRQDHDHASMTNDIGVLANNVFAPTGAPQIDHANVPYSPFASMNMHHQVAQASPLVSHGFRTPVGGHLPPPVLNYSFHGLPHGAVGSAGHMQMLPAGMHDGHNAYYRQAPSYNGHRFDSNMPAAGAWGPATPGQGLSHSGQEYRGQSTGGQGPNHFAQDDGGQSMGDQGLNHFGQEYGGQNMDRHEALALARSRPMGIPHPSYYTQEPDGHSMGRQAALDLVRGRPVSGPCAGGLPQPATPSFSRSTEHERYMSAMREGNAGGVPQPATPSLSLGDEYEQFMSVPAGEGNLEEY